MKSSTVGLERHFIVICRGEWLGRALGLEEPGSTTNGLFSEASGIIADLSGGRGLTICSTRLVFT